MSHLGPLIDTFERMMAAVAFAEQDDQEMARWILRPEPSPPVLRVADDVRSRATAQPELRL